MKKFIDLGKKLEEHRKSQHESITFVANSIKIDRTYISKLENGHERPSQEVLNKLISHYSLTGVEATRLWTLAGYREGMVAMERKEVNYMNGQNGSQLVKGSQTVDLQIKVPEDKLILYTDSVIVTQGQFGIVFNFAQALGPTNQQMVVSRIGMSKEHAKALLKVLEQEVHRNESVAEDKKKETTN